jgi:hypothetical protein
MQTGRAIASFGALMLACSASPRQRLLASGVARLSPNLGDASTLAPPGSAAAPPGTSSAPTIVCDMVLCLDHVSVTSTLRIKPQELARAKSKLCFDWGCLETTKPVLIDGIDRSTGHDRVWSDPSFYADPRVVPGSRGLSRLEFDAVIPRNRITDSMPYSMHIETPSGRVLLHVSRRVHMVPMHPNPNPCDDPCKVAAQRLYADSASLIACDGSPFDSGLELHLYAPKLVESLHVGGAEMCRNGACTRLDLTGYDSVLGARWLEYDRWAEGPLRGSWVSINGRTPNEVVVYVLGDPIQLSNGDHYVVSLYRHRPDQVLVGFDRRVRYEESYPHGRQCDTVPSRQVVAHIGYR